MNMLKMYSVYDHAIEQYNKPFFCRTETECRRIVQQAIKQDSQLTIAPHDYHVYYMGSFHSETGMDHVPETPKPVFSILELVPDPGTD